MLISQSIIKDMGKPEEITYLFTGDTHILYTDKMLIQTITGKNPLPNSKWFTCNLAHPDFWFGDSSRFGFFDFPKRKHADKTRLPSLPTWYNKEYLEGWADTQHLTLTYLNGVFISFLNNIWDARVFKHLLDKQWDNPIRYYSLNTPYLSVNSGTTRIVIKQTMGYLDFFAPESKTQAFNSAVEFFRTTGKFTSDDSLEYYNTLQFLLDTKGDTNVHTETL
jgi:hypothetical protein